MRFFVDACIAPKLARAVALLDTDHEIVHLHDRFPPNTPDATWLRALADEGDWVVVSADPRISSGKIERAAWRESGLTCFFFVERFAGLKIWAQAEVFVHWWPLLKDQAKRVLPGASFLMPRKGNRFRQIGSP